MIRYSDIAAPISLNLLREIDKSPPGTFYGQTKKDGKRRMIFHTPGTFEWLYLAKNRTDSQQMPTPLRAAFESMKWPEGIGVDAEFVGTRQKDGTPELYLFDQLARAGKWIGNEPFTERYASLARVFAALLDVPPSIHLLPAWSNPGLVDRFMEQMQDPLSEGLMIRRADSKLIGSPKGCAVNALWMKCKFREATKENP